MEFNRVVDMGVSDSYFFQLPKDLVVTKVNGTINGDLLELDIEGESASPKEQAIFRLGVAVPNEADDGEYADLKEIPEGATIIADKEFHGYHMISYIDTKERYDNRLAGLVNL